MQPEHISIRIRVDDMQAHVLPADSLEEHIKKELAYKIAHELMLRPNFFSKYQDIGTFTTVWQFDALISPLPIRVGSHAIQLSEPEWVKEPTPQPVPLTVNPITALIGPETDKPKSFDESLAKMNALADSLEEPEERKEV